MTYREVILYPHVYGIVDSIYAQQGTRLENPKHEEKVTRSYPGRFHAADAQSSPQFDSIVRPPRWIHHMIIWYFMFPSCVMVKTWIIK